MRTLDFSVDGQKLDKIGDFSNLIKGSKGYLRCKFKFDSDWSGHKVIAVFERNKKQLPVALRSDKTCMIPDEMSQASCFKMSLIGDKDGNRITTNKITIEQEG